MVIHRFMIRNIICGFGLNDFNIQAKAIGMMNIQSADIIYTSFMPNPKTM